MREQDFICDDHGSAFYEKYLNMQGMICEISQIAQPIAIWDLSQMAEQKEQVGIAAVALRRLEAARPFDEEKGKPLSDNRWCELAGVNPGYWRDLRKGREPSINNLDRMAAVANLSLADLVMDDDRIARGATPNVKALSGLLAAIVPLAPKGQPTAQSMRVLALALQRGLELLGPASDAPPSDKELRVAARGAVSRFHDLLQQ